MLAGRIYDAQGRLNLNNLVQAGTPIEPEVATFRRLLEQLGKSTALADQLVARLISASPPPVGSPTALPMKRVADLRELPGFDEDTIGALREFVVFLPLRFGRTQSTSTRCRPSSWPRASRRSRTTRCAAGRSWPRASG
jgi:type II secretory pathway component PulK